MKPVFFTISLSIFLFLLIALKPVSSQCPTNKRFCHTFDLANQESIDVRADADNTILIQNTFCPECWVYEYAYDNVSINPINPSTCTQCDAQIRNSAVNPGDDDAEDFRFALIFDHDCSFQPYFGGESLVQNDEEFQLNSDGNLLVELYESFEDFPNQADAVYQSGELTVCACQIEPCLMPNFQVTLECNSTNSFDVKVEMLSAGKGNTSYYVLLNLGGFLVDFNEQAFFLNSPVTYGSYATSHQLPVSISIVGEQNNACEFFRSSLTIDCQCFEQERLNDECPSATNLPDLGCYPLNNFCATGDDLTNSCGNNDEKDIWFTYTPNFSGELIISACTCPGNVSPVLAVFDNCPTMGGTEMLCNGNDNGSGGADVCSPANAASLQVPVTQNQAIYIRFAGSGFTHGDCGENALKLQSLCQGLRVSPHAYCTGTDQYAVDLTFYDLGTGSPGGYNVMVGANVVQNISTTGTYSFGPFPISDTSNDINVVSTNDPNCNVVYPFLEEGLNCPACFQPPNLPLLHDDCAKAITANLGDNPLSTICASGTALCQVRDNKDVWFTYTSTFDGTLQIKTCECTLLNPTITVMDNCPGAGGTIIGCTPLDAEGLCGTGINHAALSLPITNGQTIYIRIAGENNEEGDCGNAGLQLVQVLPPIVFLWECVDKDVFRINVQINDASLLNENYDIKIGGILFPNQSLSLGDNYFGNFSTDLNLIAVVATGLQTGANYSTTEDLFPLCPCIEPPPNDVCSNAQIALLGKNFVNGFCADGTDITSCGTGDRKDIWYQYVADFNGSLHLDLCNCPDDFPATISVWDDCPDNLGFLLDCQEDAVVQDACIMPSTNSGLSITVTQGTTYYIRLAAINELFLGCETKSLLLERDCKDLKATLRGNCEDTQNFNLDLEVADLGSGNPNGYTVFRNGVELMNDLNQVGSYPMGFYANNQIITVKLVGNDDGCSVEYVFEGLELKCHEHNNCPDEFSSTQNSCPEAINGLIMAGQTDLYLLNNLCATPTHPGCFQTDSKDIWYKMTPSDTGDLIISTCNCEGTLEATIAVYDACPFENGGQLVACSKEDMVNKCNGDNPASLKIPVTAFVPIYIRIAGENHTRADCGVALLLELCTFPTVTITTTCISPYQFQTDIAISDFVTASDTEYDLLLDGNNIAFVNGDVTLNNFSGNLTSSNVIRTLSLVGKNSPCEQTQTFTKDCRNETFNNSSCEDAIKLLAPGLGEDRLIGDISLSPAAADADCLDGNTPTSTGKWYEIENPDDGISRKWSFTRDAANNAVNVEVYKSLVQNNCDNLDCVNFSDFDDGQDILSAIWRDEDNANRDGISNVPASYYLYVYNESDVVEDFHFTLSVSDASLSIHPIVFSGKVLPHSNWLQWSIINDKDWEKFIVERKALSNDWQPIAQIFSNGQKDFQWEDVNPSVESYYRLKLMDSNEQSAYSQVILLKREQKNIQILKVFPNPVSKTLLIDVWAKDDVDLSLQLTDVTGREILKKRRKLEKGKQQVELGLGNFSSGVYFLTLRGREVSILKRVIKL